ncbi:hypothetical protein ACHAP5_003563 [Fusarium lateritium]
MLKVMLDASHQPTLIHSSLPCSLPLLSSEVFARYATIQGKDCLVQKFRNSSVMLEAEHYRPKVSGL